MVGSCGDRLQLPLELAPAAQTVEGERAVVHRTQHGASRFTCVCAVAEAALRREDLDVLERGADVAVPELQFTEAGRVDHERAAG